ncbi:MAG TPA: Bax inhibitor-1/YccA family protein [Candidatus Bathyarchaeia archaeon]|nr:Bax inhibitor-1/YccA family protein [Candidatus Bathyarchaeia archaeon]
MYPVNFDPEYDIQQRVFSFMYGVYAWMACALGVSAVISGIVASSPKIFAFFFANPALVIGIVIMQFALVLGLSFAIMRMSFATALTMFLVYAASVGVTLSTIFYIYTPFSIITTFITAAGMFGAMAVYGYVTKTDLTSLGSMSMMVLVGMIIAMVVNLFVKSQALDFAISGIGVLVFVALTAYDTQQIKRIGASLLENREAAQKIMLIGALQLYLDFLNLFLFLLQFVGKKNND